MILVSVFSSYVSKIPIAALVSVMIMISITTFSIESVKKIHKTPIIDTVVMIITVITVLITQNLAIGVILGVIINALVFYCLWSVLSVPLLVSKSVPFKQ